MADSMRRRLRRLVSTLPAARWLARTVLSLGFTNSPDYWEKRYAGGGDSGPGSRNELAEFKATVLKQFISEHGITSVVDLGCGDGRQIGLIEVDRYVGLDVSPTAVDICKNRFKDDPSKTFHVLGSTERFDSLSIAKADMAMSLDVLYHLVEDEIFETYLRNLFSSAERFVVIYSTNFDQYGESPHVRHRRFTEFVRRHVDGWVFYQKIDNPHMGDYPEVDFFIFKRRDYVG